MDTNLILIIAAIAVLAGALAVYGFARAGRKVEALTTDVLLKTAQEAVDEAQRLADSRARAIEDDKAALAADLDRIAKARVRLAGAPAA